MIFTATELAGVFIVDIDAKRDPRGMFARLYCADTLAAKGLAPADAQWSVSCNDLKGTLRGLHYQAAPHAETKLVRCIRGRIWDVAVDLRPGSATRGRHVAVELTAENWRGLYIPEGCAHGFQTLEDHSDVLYGISPSYVPDAFRGLRYNDPDLAIDWPLPPVNLSQRDADLPGFAS
jgi:dTDP-4-dehydrorhamnose 3,5-epimerase